MPTRSIVYLAAIFAVATPAFSSEFEPSMRAFVEDHVLGWANAPAIVGQVMEQNAAHSGLSQGEIDELDQAWRSQVGAADTPLITSVLSNAASAFLLEQQDAAGGIISEVFVTDNLGLNAASSGVTSDYWQGDEAKFTEVYGHGPDAMHFGEVEFDDSAQAYVGQVSLPVIHPESKEVIGVMTVALNAEAL